MKTRSTDTKVMTRNQRITFNSLNISIISFTIVGSNVLNFTTTNVIYRRKRGKRKDMDIYISFFKVRKLKIFIVTKYR